MPNPAEPILVHLVQDPWYQFVLPYVVGIFSPLAAQWLTNYFYSPRLKVSSEPGPVGPVRVDGAGGLKYDAKFVRLGVENRRKAAARDCRAYLVKIEVRRGNGFEPVGFYKDTQRLRWAYEGEDGPLHEGIDIPNGVTVYFDLFSTKDEGGGLSLVQVANRKARYDPDALRNKVEFGNTYKFHVVLTSQNAPVVSAACAVRLGGTWEDVTVEPSP